MNPVFLGTIWLLLILLVMNALWRKRRRGRRGFGVGTGAAGTFYELLSEDKRKAVEIIVEKGAEKRRPEYPDDTVPPDQNPDTSSRTR